MTTSGAIKGITINRSPQVLTSTSTAEPLRASRSRTTGHSSIIIVGSPVRAIRLNQELTSTISPTNPSTGSRTSHPVSDRASSSSDPTVHHSAAS